MDEIIYIITGITGYVGNVIAKKLLEENKHVIGLARSKEKVKKVFEKDYENLEIVYGDIRSKEDIAKLFKYENKKYLVIHLVAYVTIGEGDKETLYSITLGGTKNIVDESLKHDVIKFINISSTEAIEKDKKSNKDFTSYYVDETKLKEGYPRAKASADKYILDAYKKYGLNATILFLSGVIGPYDYSSSHLTQMFIDYYQNHLIASCKGGYSLIDVRDIASIILNVVSKGEKGKGYIISNRYVSITEMLEIVREKYHKKKIVTLPLFIAYIGLPFIHIYYKIIKKRPLYTLKSLETIKEKTDFIIEDAKNTFDFKPRDIKESILDEIDFLLEEGYIR